MNNLSEIPRGFGVEVLKYQNFEKKVQYKGKCRLRFEPNQPLKGGSMSAP